MINIVKAYFPVKKRSRLFHKLTLVGDAVPEHLKNELRFEKFAMQKSNSSRIISWIQSLTVAGTEVQGPSEVSLRTINLQIAHQETPVKRTRVNLMVSKNLNGAVSDTLGQQLRYF